MRREEGVLQRERGFGGVEKRAAGEGVPLGFRHQPKAARPACAPPVYSEPSLLSTELVSSPSSSARRRSSPMSSRAGRFPAAAVAARSGEASTTPALEPGVTWSRRRQDAAALPDAPGQLQEVRRRRRDRPMGRVRQPIHPPDGGPCRLSRPANGQDHCLYPHARCMANRRPDHQYPFGEPRRDMTVLAA